MYKSFRVKNFRCFRDLEISDLGRVNLIAGKNNTGKTALMEAMHVLAGTYSGQVLLRNPALRRAILNYESESEPRLQLSWSTIFRGLQTDCEIKLSASVKASGQKGSDADSRIELEIRSVSMSSAMTDEESPYRSFGRSFDLLPDDTDMLKLTPSLDDGATYLVLTHSGVLYPRLKPSRFRPSQFLHARTGASGRDIERRFNRMQRAKKINVLVSNLEFFEPCIKDVRINTEGWRPFLIVDIGLDSMIAMSDSGEGVGRMSDVVLAMHEAKGGLIFIDEIENGIHHSVQRKVWQAIGKLARELDIQVFATTHSLEMIRAAYEAFSEDGKLDEYRLHRLDRDREGDIEAVTYNEFGIESAMATNWEVRG